jgi:hypothetical protein
MKLFLFLPKVSRINEGKVDFPYICDLIKQYMRIAPSPIATFRPMSVRRPSRKSDSTPCVFTEEEFDREIVASEKEGAATAEEVAAMFAKWGR